MRVTCKCGHKAAIKDSRAHSPDFVTLYLQCLDVMCSHSWVAHLTFHHTLSPSAKMVDRLVFDRLQEMPPQQQREMFNQLGLVGVSPT